MQSLSDLVFGTYPSWSHLVVRVIAGIIFFAHGSQKVFGWFGGPGLKATMNTFQQHLKIPPAAAALAAFTECFGGLALIVGLLARPAALGLTIVMLVAIAKVHGRNGLFLNMQLTPGKGHGYEFNLALIGMTVSILIGGAGMWSIDRLIRAFGD
jgi:putative oxidoreductase